MRSARCPERGTPGAGNGPEKRAGRKTGTALRADFTGSRIPDIRRGGPESLAARDRR